MSLTEDAEDYGEDTEPFGRGYARASMWQLYGDDHRGVCLAFDREQTSFSPEKRTRRQRTDHCEAREVRARLNPDSLPSEPLKDLSPEAFHAAVDDYLEKNADLLLFTKLLDLVVARARSSGSWPSRPRDVSDETASRHSLASSENVAERGGDRGHKLPP